MICSETTIEASHSLKILVFCGYKSKTSKGPASRSYKEKVLGSASCPKALDQL